MSHLELAPHMSVIAPFAPSLYEVHAGDLQLRIGQIVADRWRIDKRIGEGPFGSVYYQVTDVERPTRSYNMKIESNTPNQDSFPKLLPLQHKLWRALKEKNARHFPGLRDGGETEHFKYLVVGLVGKNLEELRSQMPEKRFTLRTALHVAKALLYSLEEIHFAGYVHRDVKPFNAYVGKPPVDAKFVYLLNYDLCRKFVNDEGLVLQPRENVSFRGSPMYASVNALMQKEHGRVDDMWSWLFTVIEVTIGKLPWWDAKKRMKPPSDSVQDYFEWLAKVKKEFVNDPSQLLAGCPREFRKVYDHLSALRFDSQPDYALCIQVLDEVFARKQYNDNIPLDWEPKPRTINVSRRSSFNRHTDI